MRRGNTLLKVRTSTTSWRRPQGDLDFGFDDPTLRERSGVDTPAFRRLSYQAKTAHLVDAIAADGDDHLIEDGEPQEDSEKGMEERLDQAFVREDDSPISEWDNQYRVGQPIYDALTPKERAAYGISQGNAGGAIHQQSSDSSGISIFLRNYRG